jgi:hypothetical protein
MERSWHAEERSESRREEEAKERMKKNLAEVFQFEFMANLKA